MLIERLKADDPVVRAAAAPRLGELKPANGAAALAEAYASASAIPTTPRAPRRSRRIAKYGAAAATPVLTSALADKDWAVRVRAAMLLKQLDPAAAAGVDAQIRPAPTTLPVGTYDAPRLTASAGVDAGRTSTPIAARFRSSSPCSTRR